MYICNDVRTWATWDHYTHMCQDTGRRTNKKLSKRKEQKKRTGWKPKNDEQKKRIQEVMEKDDDKFDEDLATFFENY